MKKLLTADEVAEKLNVSRWRVYELARIGELPCITLGKRQKRFDEVAIENFVAQSGKVEIETSQNANVIKFRRVI